MQLNEFFYKSLAVIYTNPNHEVILNSVAERSGFGNFKVVLPVTLSLIILVALIVTVMIVRRRSELSTVVIIY